MTSVTRSAPSSMPGPLLIATTGRGVIREKGYLAAEATE